MPAALILAPVAGLLLGYLAMQAVVIPIYLRRRRHAIEVKVLRRKLARVRAEIAALKAVR